MQADEKAARAKSANGKANGKVAKGKGRAADGASTSNVDVIAPMVLALQERGSKLQALERAVVRHALEQCDGNISAAARLLGIDRKAMERRAAKVKRRKR